MALTNCEIPGRCCLLSILSTLQRNFQFFGVTSFVSWLSKFLLKKYLVKVSTSKPKTFDQNEVDLLVIVTFIC